MLREVKIADELDTIFFEDAVGVEAWTEIVVHCVCLIGDDLRILVPFDKDRKATDIDDIDAISVVKRCISWPGVLKIAGRHLSLDRWSWANLFLQVCDLFGDEYLPLLLKIQEAELPNWVKYGAYRELVAASLRYRSA